MARFSALKDRVTGLPVVGGLLAAYERANGLRFMRWAAAIALFAYLSLFPLLVLAFMVFGVVLDHYPGVRDDLESFLKESIPLLFDPEQSQRALNVEKVARSTTTAGVVSIIGLVLAGLGWISASIEGVRRMQGAMARSRNALISKAQDILTLLVVGTILLLALILATLVQVLGSRAIEWLGFSGEQAGVVRVLALVLSGAILWLVLVILYGAAWWRRPHRQFRAPALGALLASVTLVLLGKMSILLVGRTLSTPVYGTLAIAAALLLFLYVASAVMLFAAAWVAILEGAPRTQEEVAFDDREGHDVALPTADGPTEADDATAATNRTR